MTEKPRYVWLDGDYYRFRAEICVDTHGRLSLVSEGAARFRLLNLATGKCKDSRGYTATLSKSGRRTVRALGIPIA